MLESRHESRSMVARDSTANTPGPLTSSRPVSGKPDVAKAYRIALTACSC